MDQKIQLCPMTRTLLHEYYKGFVMDPSIFADMGRFREYAYAPERVDAYFDKLRSQTDRVDLLILLDEKPIGEIALKHIDKTAGQCELSIHLQNDSVKGKGYGTQAERLILEYAFRTLGMTAVIADAILKNERSRHTLEKVGFHQTGRDDTFVYYRISRSDWLKREDGTREKTRWIFFDIGSTLADEEEAYRHRVRDMIRNTSVTLEQYYEKRIQFAKEGYNGDQKAIEYFGLTKTPWHSEDETPFPDCEPTLQVLHDRGYQLGIIANQEPGAKARLDAWGLGRFFSVIASSAELGVAKPNKEIFLRALEMAGCRPEQAVMVGDRLDNDIRPAKELGMTTIRIRKGLAVYMEPSCEAEVPDHTADCLAQIPAIVGQTAK